MKSFDTKVCNDFEVSSRKFESFDTKVSEVKEPDNGIPEVSRGNFQGSSRKFPWTQKFRTEGLKVSSRRFHQMIH